jgi:site-specific recombinase XerD
MTRPATIRATIAPYCQTRIRLGELKPATAREHRYILTDLAATIGARPLRLVGPADIERAVTQWHHVAPSTRRMRIAVLRSWHTWCVARNYVTPHLLERIRPPRVPRRPPRSLSARQVTAAVRAAPDARGRAMIVLAVQLGLRCVELARLDTADIDHDRHQVRIRGKGDHERILPLTAETLTVIADLPHAYRPGPLLRRHTDGGPLKPATIGQLLCRYLDAAGVKTAAHDGIAAHILRHTCAHHLIERGADVLDVAAVLGHTNVATTMTYLPSSANQLRDVIDGRTYLPT